MAAAISCDCRRFLGTAAMTMAAARLGLIGAAGAQPRETTPAAVPTIKPGAHTSFGALQQIDAGVVHVGYAEAGPADGPAVILLHGWPYDIYALMDALHIEQAILAGYDWGARTANIIAALWPERCKALVAASGYLIGSREINKLPLPPKAELAWWYQCYSATERGQAGYKQYRRDFARLIWRLASPQWDFDEATFERSAASFDHPDHVSIVSHNYRWRLGLAEGEPQYDALEQRLAQGPVISVPTITLEGDANGAPHPGASAYAKKFSGP